MHSEGYLVRRGLPVEEVLALGLPAENMTCLK